MKIHRFFTLALAFVALPLFAQDATFETPPTLSAAAILKPEFAAGNGFTVRDAVTTYAGRNGYLINSDYGTFAADGNVMLVRRVAEIGAITKLREVSRTDEYAKALGSAAASPLLVAKDLITNPVSTVTGVPRGLWKFVNRAGQALKERTEGRQRSQYEDSNAAQLIGFAKAKRVVALQLGVDPYSSNEALQRELNGVSWAAYAGKVTFTIATMPVGGGLGLALTASGVTNTFNQAIRDQSPGDLRLASLKRLLAMDVSREDADSFLNNTAFSPTVQTALVLHLEALSAAANRSSFVRLANEESVTEGDALFFLSTSRLLAELQSRGRNIARLDTIGALPIAFGDDGTLIVALEWDYAAWTENAANFVAQLKAAKFDGKAPPSMLIALTGDASPLTQTAVQKAGIELATRLVPGPLQ